jgi:hypothetical protein
MENARIDELLELLSENSVANVQNGLFHSLALWLDRHVKGEDVDRRKREAFSMFAGPVCKIARQRQYQRKVWPENKPVPSVYQYKVIEAISHKVLRKMRGLSFDQGLMFLAELWGRWILICPEAILRSSSEYARVVESVKGEDELIENMLWYLDIYGNM